ncbi:MAG TPA: hypothetical protein VJT80_05225 [Steroidobacteraceae bacterium]|nr:hypothetical protein [Steroidobacteraceae bacterium]
MHDNVREQQSVRLGAAARRALCSGASASVCSALALSICSRIDEGSYAGGLNGPSQWLWGQAQAYTREASLRHTAVGYIVHHLTSVFWATSYELIFGEPDRRKTPLRRCADAAVSSAGAYVVDYYLTPPRFRPGFRKHLRTPSMYVVYGAFALGLAAASIVRDRNRRRNTQ